MEDWYSTQDYFCEERMKKIKEWMNQELFNIFQYTGDYVTYKQAS
jgi:hypothetical protein